MLNKILFSRFHEIDIKSMCFICQKKISEPLKCPLNTKANRDNSEIYSSFLNNVSTFRALGTLSVALNFGEDMTACELVQNQAA